VTLQRRPTQLAWNRYIEHLQSDGDRLAELANRDLSAAVPFCPGWDVREVLRHTGSVFNHKIACMRLDRRAMPGEWPSQPSPGEDPVLWFRAALEALIAELLDRGPEQATFTWYEPDQSVGFWYRRMALEAVVHRVDVENAVDSRSAVDDALALDGIDEVLDRFLCARDVQPDPDGPHGAVALTAAGRTWTVLLEADAPSLLETAAGADATLSGDPDPLFVHLWGRRDRDGLDASGDEQLLDALRRRIAAATQ
jgi:uncharacterized protein (TIGR03083 family)